MAKVPDRKITLLWPSEDAIKKYWEPDWLSFLFATSGTVVHSSDPELNRFENRAVIVTSSLDDRYQKYFQEYADRGLAYGIILLSDEWLKYNTPQYYPTSAKFIFRNCYTPAYLGPNVQFFPLGYKQGFWSGYTGPTPDRITDRPYQWSFAGFTKKADRELMVYHVTKGLGKGFIKTTSGWDSHDALTTSQYRDLLLHTVFVPSPSGNAAVECFRTWEALEAGCIPIVPRISGQQIDHHYFELVKACDFVAPPFLEISDWDEVEAKGTEWWNKAKYLQTVNYKWWQKFKTHNQKRFKTACDKLW
jgi:hypothetical protein